MTDLQRIDIGDGSLAVYDSGTPEGDANRTLLLVHGFPLDHTMWRDQIDALDQSYRVIAPDLRGFGQSTLMAVSKTDTLGMEQHADDLAHLLDALGVDEPVHFCGLSMGGYIAWQFWRKYARRVRSLILCDTKATADSAEAAAGRLAMADRVLAEGNGFVADAMLPKLLAPQASSDNSDVAERLRTTIENTAPESIAAAQRGMAARIDANELLASIDVPTLVLVGQHDAITTADEMRSIAAAIAGSQFVEIPQAGHMAPMEASAETNPAIRDFLSEV